MSRTPEEPPDVFARLVADEFNREIGKRRLSGRKLAEILGRSEKYTRERRAMKYAFSLNDIERFSAFIGELPEVFVQRVGRKAGGIAQLPYVGGLAEDSPIDEPLAAGSRGDVADPEITDA